ncbi:PB1 domain-containing protein [Heracleum sosnowskyi]|uniref:PB1 domain-containing protein n=1 Tax=Heracleum sosnowskyi TaxID=360622 RepID=A0AAD8GNN0_9APIA|nr:PB1 domain-containing protein [Heracleum sosnowskyi]KAK1385892.1 PB1 domain-containing protein [Heracleum sosnowskyi]
MSMNGPPADEKSRKIAGESGPGSVKHKVKFLCSYGGKILPRPFDNHLKYVGGETRVVSVPHDSTFSELMKKLTSLVEGDMILKYQLLPEELDALISVKSDEDIRHMFEECDRHSTGGTPRLRAFLFPANPTIIENRSMEPQALEQRYIDAINGIIRSTTPPNIDAINGIIRSTTPPNIDAINGIVRSTTTQIPPLKPTPQMTSYPSFSIASPCSSPRSPDSYTNENIRPMPMAMPSPRPLMTRVHSSPSISNMPTVSQNVVNPQQTPQNHHHHYKHAPMAPQFSHQHHHHQQYNQASYAQPTKPPVDVQRSGFVPERFSKVRSIGRAETSRYHMDNVQNHYYSMNRQHRGNMSSSNKYIYDDYVGGYGEPRNDTHAISSHSRSPSQGFIGTKAWDSAL